MSGGGPRVVVSTAAFHACVFVLFLGILNALENDATVHADVVDDNVLAVAAISSSKRVRASSEFSEQQPRNTFH